MRVDHGIMRTDQLRKRCEQKKNAHDPPPIMRTLTGTLPFADQDCKTKEKINKSVDYMSFVCPDGNQQIKMHKMYENNISSINTYQTNSMLPRH